MKMHKQSRPALHLLVGAATCLVLCASARAGGFAATEQSAAGLGVAYAGAAAAAQDPSTVYFNPAGMSRLSAKQVSVDLVSVVPEGHFQNSGSSIGGTAITGGDASLGGVAVLPALYLSFELSPTWHVGLGVNSPMDLHTGYDAHWVGRYQAIKSSLETVNINPSVAWQVSERLALGLGVDAQRAKMDFTRAYDFGGLSGGVPQSADGSQALSASDWGFGVNAGMLYQVAPDMRVGAAYRSGIRHRLEGDSTVMGTPGALAGNPLFQNSKAKVQIHTPDVFSISVVQDYGGGALLLGDISWTRWSLFDELRVKYDNGAPDQVTPEQWRSAWRVSLGTSTPFGSAGAFRLGIAWDQSPVTDSTRTASIPDRNRIWLSVGAGWNFSRGSVDLGYTHFLMKTATISTTSASAGTLSGQVTGGADVVGLQGHVNF